MHFYRAQKRYTRSISETVSLTLHFDDSLFSGKMEVYIALARKLP